jgi:hypothetical protein
MKNYTLFAGMCFLAVALTGGWAQDSGGQPAAGGDPQPSQGGDQQGGGALPALSGGTQGEDNPPISGLDQPSLEPRMASRSFLVPGLSVSQSADSNVSGGTGTSWTDVTHVLGDAALQKMWNRYDIALDYLGGGSFYSNGSLTSAQMHQADLDQRYLWRTGQLAVRDSFSYLPEGSFGYGAYGGMGAVPGIGLGGSSLGSNLFGFFGPGQFASLGQEPRISNVAIADITQYFSPRTSVTLAGSYGLVHFTSGGEGMLNSNQITAQAGYNYQISRKDQIALLYGYQAFHYPASVGIDFNTHLLNVMYGHRISGRMDFQIGAGPQFVAINSSTTGSGNQISASGHGVLRYRFPRTSLSLTYDRYNTSGSGFFVGATSDVARLDASRQMGRKWTLNTDLGYAHDKRLASSALAEPGQTFSYTYLGAAVRRNLGRDFGVYASYQYNYLWFDSSHCAGLTTACSTNGNRNIALIGLDWHPRPIRLD